MLSPFKILIHINVLLHCCSCGKIQIGNWSRWLTDLFGIDDDDNDDESFKSFHLLNALSDLMMLPKDMLLDPTVRKEVGLFYKNTYSQKQS